MSYAKRGARRGASRAAPEFRMELYGAKELEKALRELPKRTGRNAMRRACSKD